MRCRASCTSGSAEDRSAVAVAGPSNVPLASLGGLIKASPGANSGLSTAEAAPSPTIARTCDLSDEPTDPASLHRPAATRASPMIKPNPAAHTLCRTDRLCPSEAGPCHADWLG